MKLFLQRAVELVDSLGVALRTSESKTERSVMSAKRCETTVHRIGRAMMKEEAKTSRENIDTTLTITDVGQSKLMSSTFSRPTKSSEKRGVGIRRGGR